jgi:hypothetical protein
MGQYSPSDFVDDIGNKKAMLVNDPAALKEFNAFFICRLLSFHIDSVLIVEKANQMSHMSDYDLYRYLTMKIRKMKRKWVYSKVGVMTPELEAISEYYGYSIEKAIEAQKLLSPEFVKTIMSRLDMGGSGRKVKSKPKK